MYDRFKHSKYLHGVCASVVCLAALQASEPVLALDVGFEGLLLIEASDNVGGANSPLETDGSIQSAVFGIYGEHKSQKLNAAFSGELDSRNVSTSGDSNVDSVSHFLGAAEFKLTPRSWTWYFGDILGGVRSDDAIQTSDVSNLTRRNVFVTGPAFEYEQLGISRTFARALYVNQTQNSTPLETLYSATFRHERDLTSGSYYGVRLGNIYTDVPRDVDVDADVDVSHDFNRSTFALFHNRQIGFLGLFGEIGATRYDSDGEVLDGLNAEARVTQELGPGSSVSVYFTQDLSDQSLSAIESLVASGEEGVGVAPNTSGFFTERRVGAQYSFKGRDTTFDLGAGMADLDYEEQTGDAQATNIFDEEDRQNLFVSSALSKRLSARLRTELGISYEEQEYLNRSDNSKSILAEAQLVYSLTTAFSLQLGYTFDQANGLRTRIADGTRVTEDVDVTENRLSIGLRWAPPSRASQDLTVELKSLLN